jgi:hypothetical protein
MADIDVKVAEAVLEATRKRMASLTTQITNRKAELQMLARLERASLKTLGRDS